MRAFIGLALPSRTQKSLAASCARLAKQVSGVRWVAEESLHITLKFLGEISLQQQRQMEALLKDLAPHHEPFVIRLGRWGAFPSLQAPRILWVGLGQGESRSTRLAEDIERVCRVSGFAAEERLFSAHVTIGRVFSPAGSRCLDEVFAQTNQAAQEAWQANSVTLYQSRLIASGSRYSVLADVPLGKDAEGSAPPAPPAP